MAANDEKSIPKAEMPKLPDIFDDIFQLSEKIENSTEASNSVNTTRLILRGIEQSEKAIGMVNELNLFSENEELEEVATADMKYLLLPAFLAYFTTTKACKPEDRQTAVTKSLAYNQDFLRLCKLYGLTDIELAPAGGDPSNDPQAAARIPPLHGQQGIKTMANTRAKKIEQLKRKQENARELSELRRYVDQEHVDDEVKRKFYRALIYKWIFFSSEELENLKMEVSMLEHMEKMRVTPANQLPQPQEKPKIAAPHQQMLLAERLLAGSPMRSPLSEPFRPMILTRSAVEKAVFGAGYPSLPTYTVEEWFDQQAAAGAFPQPPNTNNSMEGSAGQAQQREDEEAEKDRKEDEDDAEALFKARQWDEWKDDHRRGEGNTHNKG